MSSGIQLLERIRAVQDFLASAVAAPAALQKAKAVQFQGLVDAIGKVHLTLPQAMDANNTFSTACWSPDEISALTSAVLDRCSDVPAVETAAGRRPLQDYTAIAGYIRSEQWDSLQGDALSSSEKMTLLVNVAVNLGLRLPTEQSTQAMTALFLLVGEKNHASLTPAVKHNIFKSTKGQLKNATNQAPAVPHILRLPASPADLQTSFPAIWSQAFGTSLPEPARISTADLMTCMASIPMRTSRADCQSRQAASVAPAPFQLDAGLLPQAQLFANGVMQQLQQMQLQIQNLSRPQLQQAQPVLQFGTPALENTPSQQRMLNRMQSRLALQDDAATAVPAMSAAAAAALAAVPSAVVAAADVLSPSAASSLPDAAALPNDEDLAAKLPKGPRGILDAVALVQEHIAAKSDAAKTAKKSPTSKADGADKQAKAKAKPKAKAKAPPIVGFRV